MDEAIDLQKVVENLIAENEQLREQLAKIRLQSAFTLTKVQNSFAAMSWQEKYFLAAIVCTIAITMTGMLRDLRAIQQ